MESDLSPATAARLPAVIDWQERVVRERFWKKLLRLIGHIPFAEDLGAAYFCFVDRETPPHVKALALAVLAYFVLRFEFVRAIARSLGLVEDAVALGLGLRLMADHIKPRHREQARRALNIKDRAQRA